MSSREAKAASVSKSAIDDRAFAGPSSCPVPRSTDPVALFDLDHILFDNEVLEGFILKIGNEDNVPPSSCIIMDSFAVVCSVSGGLFYTGSTASDAPETPRISDFHLLNPVLVYVASRPTGTGSST
jgi:hypothetical protein